MRQIFDLALRRLLSPDREGGFVNDPKDPGGMTNLGVTATAWADWVGRNVTEAEMRSLTPDAVRSFYHQKYWMPIQGDQLPVGTDYCVFDCAVNSGPHRAIELLQEALGTAQDGVLGPLTMRAATSALPSSLIPAYAAVRLAYLKGLPGWEHFGGGWERRVGEVRTEALVLIAQPMS